MAARRVMQLSTGLPHLDRVFRGIMAGDNIVWQVDSVEDYVAFAEPYADHARARRQRLVYFRFADHRPLLGRDSGAVVHEVRPEEGFEPFMQQIYRTINEEGRGTLYLFDCLSQLAPDWKSDRMLGNFFMLTCPHLYDRAAIAYFAIFRNYHSFHAVTPISNTTQILVDAYRRRGRVYIQPMKVQYRHSSSMYMLHVRDGDAFEPVTQSAVITETLAGVPWARSNPAGTVLGFWSKTFAEADAVQQQLDQGQAVEADAGRYFQRILRMLISRDEPVLELARQYFRLADLLAVRHRMIGTGLIGGKSVGMLLARAIVAADAPGWAPVMEMHDSFYVGADVFYTYLVQNGCWWMMQKHKMAANAEDETETARRRILAGEFPDYIVAQFADMLEYFGQSPIIVRSSSILEDSFGNAFAGKYDSVFCANQGGQHKRLEDFLCAVRTVYASTMGEEAIRYRSKRGLLRHDEQMALLIQRVSGATYGNLFFPQAAGVGFSFNPYVWHRDIDPEAGVIRLVFGVGTRAVDRADDDYTRVVALNAPFCRPESTLDEVRQYAQRRVDVLDLETNQLTSAMFEDVCAACDGLPLSIFTSRDRALERRLRQQGMPAPFTAVLTFEDLLRSTDFVDDMRLLFRTLEAAYNRPVDVEFTLNFFDDEHYRINLVQCRPLQVPGGGEEVTTPDAIDPDRLIMRTHGAVIGVSQQVDLDWLVYVPPAVYGEMAVPRRYEVARLIGDLLHVEELEDAAIMLLGPGRWGTTTPSLGVPVTFTEITPVSVLCEIVAMRENLVPEVSLGTHFFNEMVENNMLYMAHFPRRDGAVLRDDRFAAAVPNRLPELLPPAADWCDAIHVARAGDIAPDRHIRLVADAHRQQAVCYVV